MSSNIMNKQAYTPSSNGASFPVENSSENIKDAINFQVEYYLSRDNLSRDTYLVSQMDSESYVSLEILAQFKKLRTLTTDISVIADALKGSKLVELDVTCTKVKPRTKPQRNTIILREISSSADPETIKALFSGEGGPKVVEIKSEVGDNWFVSFDDEVTAINALNWLHSQSYNGEPVRARMKTESTNLRSYYVSGSAPRPLNFVPQPFYPAPSSQPPYWPQAMPWDLNYVPVLDNEAPRPDDGLHSNSNTPTSVQGGGGERGQGRRYNNNNNNNNNINMRQQNRGQYGRRKSSPTRSAQSNNVVVSNKSNTRRDKTTKNYKHQPEPELTMAQFPPLATSTGHTQPSLPHNGNGKVFSGVSGGYGTKQFVHYAPENLAKLVSGINNSDKPPESLLRFEGSAALSTSPLTTESPLASLLMSQGVQKAQTTPQAASSSSSSTTATTTTIWGPGSKEAIVAGSPKKQNKPQQQQSGVSSAASKSLNFNEEKKEESNDNSSNNNNNNNTISTKKEIKPSPSLTQQQDIQSSPPENNEEKTTVKIEEKAKEGPVSPPAVPSPEKPPQKSSASSKTWASIAKGGPNTKQRTNK